MIRKITLSLVTMLLTLTAYGYVRQIISPTTGLTLSKMSEDTKQEIEYLPDGIRITYNFNSLIVERKSFSETIGDWKIDGFSTRHESGMPKLPVKIDRFYIPMQYDVNLETDVTDYIDIKTEVKAAPEECIDSNTYTYEEVEMKKYKGFYPLTTVNKTRVELYRGYKIILIEVCPLQYNYEESRLRCYSSISYTLRYKEHSNSPLGNQAISLNPIKSTPIGELSIPILKPGENNEPEKAIGDILPAGHDGKTMLIISNNVMAEAANRLARWKRRLGFNVTVSTSFIWDQSKIKTTINDFYKKNRHLTYLLLLGDIKALPADTATYYYLDNSYNKVSHRYAYDYRYGCLDGENDTMADIYVGRILANNIVNANSSVSKIIEYERQKGVSSDVYNNILMAAYLQDSNLPEGKPDGEEDVRFLRTAEEISEYLSSYQSKIISKLYRRDSDTTRYYSSRYYRYELIPESLRTANIWDATGTKVKNSIDEGKLAAFYRGHGNISSWHSVGFMTAHVNKLVNNYKPVFFGITCLSGAFHKEAGKTIPVLSLSKSLLMKENGGASGVISASCISYSGYNDALMLGIVDAIWPDPVLAPVCNSVQRTYKNVITPKCRLGEILEYGLARMDEWYPYSGTSSKNPLLDNWYQRRIFHVFGDPSMTFYKKKPKSFFDINIVRAEEEVIITVPISSATVSIYNELTEEQVSAVSVSGATIKFNTVHPEYVTVSVTKEGYAPYVNLGPACTEE